MSFDFEAHLKTCDYCRKNYTSIKSGSSSKPKPTIKIKSPVTRERERKLTELGAIIRGTSYPRLENIFQLKGASDTKRISCQGPIEKEMKLRALARLIRG